MTEDKKTTRTIKELREALLNSHWPKCIDIAKAIAENDSPEAREALIAALKTKRHQVRSAAMEALASYKDLSIVSLIEPHLDDLSYEARMTAKGVIKKLTGKDVPTARGE